MFSNKDIFILLSKYMGRRGTHKSDLIMMEGREQDDINSCDELISEFIDIIPAYKFIVLNCSKELLDKYPNNIISVNSESITENTVKALTSQEYDGVYIRELKSNNDWLLYNEARQDNKQFVIRALPKKKYKTRRGCKNYLERTYPQLGDIEQFCIINILQKEKDETQKRDKVRQS